MRYTATRLRNLPSVSRLRPNLVWQSDRLLLLGWGELVRVSPGIGSDRYLEARTALTEEGPGVAFASFTFSLDDPDSIVLVPRVLLRIEGDEPVLIGPPDTDVGELLSPAEDTGRQPSGRIVGDDGHTFIDAVGEATELIGAGKVEKVVLARSVEASLDSEVDPAVVTFRLIDRNPGSHVFLVDGFVGASPELLVRLESRRFESVALAGSMSPALPQTSDEIISAEHAYAADSVEQALHATASRVLRGARHLKSFGLIDHLATTFTGEVPVGAHVLDLVASLHPTAAVGGTPRDAALMAIDGIERSSRGRYAGPVGWFDGSGNGEFAVALRCAHIYGASSTLYAGAGIVSGSSPERELEETRVKLATMVDALGLNP